jgi:LmbE family N-acetylglucosaminyl deacetylase
MVTRLHDQLVPLCKPHFRLQESSLHFLISPRPHTHLDAQELAIWQALDGQASVAELRTRFGEAAERSIARFVERGLCELVPASHPIGRRRIVIVEPHMDDAVLSLGGTMWLRRGKCEFIVLTMAGRSNFTRYHFLDCDYFDVDEISALRRAESEYVLRLLGGRHLVLDLQEAPLRYQGGNWRLDWFRRHQRSIGTFLYYPSDTLELAAWTAALADGLSGLDFEELWLPLGVGMHTDHELTRNAGLAVLAANRRIEEQSTIRLYQDVPYAANYPGHTAEIVNDLRAAGGNLVPAPIDISEALTKKLQLVSNFASQFGISELEAQITNSAREEHATQFRELLYRVDTLPQPSHARFAGRAAAVGFFDSHPRWLEAHRSTRHLRIIAPQGAGRWEDSMRVLLDVFPQAQIEIYMDESCAAETESRQSPRISVRAVHKRYQGWVLSLARAATQPGPLVILPGQGHMRTGRFMATVCALSDAVVLPSMGDFVLALQRALRDV